MTSMATKMGVAALLLMATAAPSWGQTDYYNTDRSRPARIEDAHPTELYAFELKVAPLRIDQEEGGGFSQWSLLPEVAYGIFPRTSIEVGLPISALGEGSVGLGGVEVSAFHNLNVETRTLPAMAIRGDVEIPAGPHGRDRVTPSLTGIVTRTFPGARFHVNGRYSFVADEEPATEEGGHDEGRWLAGLAVDRVFPLRALLLIAEVYATQPVVEEDVEWTAGAGVRYQVNPYLAVDAGLGRSFGPSPTWHLTVGSALHVGIRSLVRVP